MKLKTLPCDCLRRGVNAALRDAVIRAEHEWLKTLYARRGIDGLIWYLSLKADWGLCAVHNREVRELARRKLAQVEGMLWHRTNR